ncbi:MAG: hypothetical protein IT378_12650 [Sandaracinaceae bacterium]|nr:hypothetical protein [Sandaracinaceae bacterium]
MRHKALAVVNGLFALLHLNVAWIAAGIAILGWLSHPGSGALGLALLLAILAGTLLVATLGVLHARLAYRLLNGGRSPGLQRALALVYVIGCPIGAIWAAPGMWDGAAVVAALYLGFFTCGLVYGLVALWTVLRP